MLSFFSNDSDPEPMDDIIQRLHGTPSKALQHDLDLKSKTAAARGKLEKAIERRTEAIEDVREAKTLLEKKREQLADAERMKAIGADVDVKRAEKEVRAVQKALKEREEDLDAAHAAAESARQAYETRLQSAREELAGALTEGIEEAHAELEEALETLQRANLELYVYDTIVKAAGVRGETPRPRFRQGWLPTSMQNPYNFHSVQVTPPPMQRYVRDFSSEVSGLPTGRDLTSAEASTEPLKRAIKERVAVEYEAVVREAVGREGETPAEHEEHPSVQPAA